MYVHLVAHAFWIVRPRPSSAYEKDSCRQCGTMLNWVECIKQAAQVRREYTQQPVMCDPDNRVQSRRRQVGVCKAMGDRQLVRKQQSTYLNDVLVS